MATANDLNPATLPSAIDSMRGALLIPFVVLLAAAAGVAACYALGTAPHFREMIFAAIGCTIIAEVALLPAVLNRGAPHGPLAMAALVGTGVHLLGSAIVAAAGLFSRKLAPMPFVGWLFVFYWTTLILLAVVLIRMLRQAPSDIAARKIDQRPLA